MLFPERIRSFASEDIEQARPSPDACVTTKCTIDLPYPEKPRCVREAFQSEAWQFKIQLRPIPYRCLYSRSIMNLMMAGRDISVFSTLSGPCAYSAPPGR
jgi:hypothetical protein